MISRFALKSHDEISLTSCLPLYIFALLKVDTPTIKHKSIIKHLFIYSSFLVILKMIFMALGARLKSKLFVNKCINPPPQLLDPIFFSFLIHFQRSKKQWVHRLEFYNFSLNFINNQTMLKNIKLQTHTLLDQIFIIVPN